MADTKKQEDYGYGIVDEVETTGGRYLRFNKGDKGRVIQLRIASKPRYVNQHWVLGNDGKQTPINCRGEECPYCGMKVPPKERLDKTAKWGWVVIDRSDSKPKVFTGPTLIARKIRKLVENPDWGDPTLYDIKIERTEEPGAGYYEVTPVRQGSGSSLTEEEKKLVDEGNFDLAVELEGSKESQHIGNYTGTDTTGAVEDPKPEDIPF